jgi:hypothetical protein
MPYIDPERRLVVDDNGIPACRNAGELNYYLTMCVYNYFIDHAGGYAGINEIMGVLEGVKLEFYRRVASPYEDLKKSVNGDVYK